MKRNIHINSSFFRTLLLIVTTLTFIFLIILGFPNHQVFASGITSLKEVHSFNLQSKAVIDCSAVTEIPATECDALISFYHNTNGENWTNNNDWLSTITPCSWYGVYCVENHVEQLNLYSNNLTGTIPSTISGLSELRKLKLYSNQLTGSIPSSIGLIPYLRELSLSYNQISGSIPPDIGNLTDLTSISIGNNQLSGSLPTELGLLSNLSNLYLYNNQLTGGIPGQLGSLSNLTSVNLGNNQLSGSIPVELGSLTNLTSLELAGNQLSGQIPVEIGSLSNLTRLSLSFNQLSGKIPPQIGNLSKLNYLYLYYNQFSEALPVEIGNLGNLLHLAVNNNQISGNIPASLGNLTKLTNLDLSVNSITGEIPSELGSISTLKILNLAVNQLEGQIPTSISNLLALTTLRLDDNLLVGPVPEGFGNLINVTDLRVDSNDLYGSLPLSLVNLTNISIFQTGATRVCEPLDASFQTWLAQIPSYWGTWTCLPAPTLQSPMNLSRINDNTPLFKWNPLSGSSSYQITVDNNADFTSPEFNKSGILTTSKVLITPLLDGTYYWHVRGKDQGGNWSPWSIKWKFTVDTTPPGKVLLVSPTNGATLTDRTPTFIWKAVTSAIKYQLIIDDNADFNSPLYNFTSLTTLNKTLSSNLVPKLYYWRVRARDAAGNWGYWSETRKISIK